MVNIIIAYKKNYAADIAIKLDLDPTVWCIRGYGDVCMEAPHRLVIIQPWPSEIVQLSYEERMRLHEFEFTELTHLVSRANTVLYFRQGLKTIYYGEWV